VLSLAYGPLLIRPDPLARVVLAGLVIFWTIRLFVQWCVYDIRLWWGHRVHTVVHILFSLLWSYFIWVYGTVLWGQLVRMADL
jgi:hypothetical protein